MKVKVLYFAEAERIVGVREEIVKFNGRSVGEFLTYLVARHPELSVLINKIAVAVNMEYVDKDALLKSGDTLAIIPPVQGG